MRCSFIVFILFSSAYSFAAESNAIGFLLNDNLAFLAFHQSGKHIIAKETKSDSKDFGKTLNVFFDGKNLGEVKLVGISKQCFKKFTEVETKSSKNCPLPNSMRFDSEGLPVPPEPPTGPCPGDLGAEIKCPPGDSNNAEMLSQPGLIQAQLTAPDLNSISKAFASKRVKFDWGVLADVQTKNRPLLISEKKLADLDGWRPVSFNQIPISIQKQILAEALKHRKVQKCTLEGSKLKSITLTEKDLQVGRSYMNKKGDQFAVPVAVREIKNLSDCDGNEMGIPAAYVIYTNGRAMDLLKAQEWNYRHLELLEAADVNGDGHSELFFADYKYNFDGFSAYDFKTGKLVSHGSSSH